MLLGWSARDWILQLNLHNLTDERTYVPNSGLFIPGPGRNLTVSLRYRF